VVLSTSVAETSLTVAGVRVVIDCGLSRVPRYDASAGLTRLHTVRVSRASADQRRGRAGRVAPGVCYRLWDVHEEHGFLASSRPEIIDAELSSLALELADAGISVGAVYALIALGLNLTFWTTKTMNFGQGSLMKGFTFDCDLRYHICGLPQVSALCVHDLIKKHEDHTAARASRDQS
jgi:ATP-dependent helicase HrpB